MTIPRRTVDFKAGTTARSSEIDTEFNQLYDLVDGKITDDNIKDGSLSLSKMNFTIGSPKYRGNVATFSDLANLPLVTHMDLATTSDSLELFGYDSVTMTWRRLGGVATLPSHNTLLARDAADSHPISAITNLEPRLSSAESTISTHTTNIASVTTKANTNAADIIALNTNKLGVGDYGIGGPVLDLNALAMTDLNNLPSKTAWYAGGGLTNAPSGYPTGTVNHIEYRSASPGYATQIFIPSIGTVDNPWIRRKVATVWGAWKQIRLNGEKLSQMVLGSVNTTVNQTYAKIDWNNTPAPANWDNTQKVFIIPKTGRYKLTVNATINTITNTTAQFYLHWTINGATPNGSLKNVSGAIDNMSITYIDDFTQGDKVNVEAYISVGTASLYGTWSKFFIEELG